MTDPTPGNATPPPPSPMAVRPAPAARPEELLPGAAIALILGIIFLMIGADFGKWLAASLQHKRFDTGTNWTDGPLAGQPVAYFDLSGGSAWRDFGEFGTGVALVVEAVLYGIAMVRPALVRPMMAAVIVVAVLGCAANGISAGMQIHAGFTQPLIALIGLALCLISAFSAKNALR